MNKQQFMKQIGEMEKDVGEYLEKECLRLFKSGGIDPERFNDAPGALAKVVMYVALRNLAGQYRPLYDKWRSDAKNLMHF